MDSLARRIPADKSLSNPEATNPAALLRMTASVAGPFNSPDKIPSRMAAF
jgi:hypothetical protein